MTKAIAVIVFTMASLLISPRVQGGSQVESGPTRLAVGQGMLAGSRDSHGIRSFKGIPYAEPSVGDMR